MRAISGPSPFAPQGCGGDTLYQGSEYEPKVAVNPTRRRNLIAVWTQDDSISNVVAASKDGGRHWTEVLVPGLTFCTGGTADSTFDVDVSFGHDGIAYLSSAVIDAGFWKLLVTRSLDGGFSWGPLVMVDVAGPIQPPKLPIS